MKWYVWISDLLCVCVSSFLSPQFVISFIFLSTNHCDYIHYIYMCIYTFVCISAQTVRNHVTCLCSWLWELPGHPSRQEGTVNVFFSMSFNEYCIYTIHVENVYIYIAVFVLGFICVYASFPQYWTMNYVDMYDPRYQKHLWAMQKLRLCSNFQESAQCQKRLQPQEFFWWLNWVGCVVFNASVRDQHEKT